MNYRTFLFSSACALALCASHAHATQPNVVEVDSVDAVNSPSGLDLTAYTAFHAASYHCASAPCPADGGEGLFLKSGTSCSPDGGSVIKDGASPRNCFYRQNLNGDLRQYGVTLGSVYDCSVSGPSSCTSVAPVTGNSPLTSMITAAQLAGLQNVTTSGVQVKITANVTIPSGVDLDLGGPTPFGNRNSLLDVPGTMFIAHAKSLKLSDHAGVHGGLLLPDWYATAPSSIADLYTMRDNMVSNGDTGLQCTGSGCTVHDMQIAGFDTSYELDNAPYNFATNVIADGDVCFWVDGGGGSMKWTSTECVPIMTNTNFDNQEYFGVTAIAESPATPGICRVTLAQRIGTSPPNVSDILNNYMVWGSGATQASGGVNMNDRYKATLISSTATTGTFDLQNSKCDDDGAGYLNGPTVTASWSSGDTKMTVSSTDQIHAGEVIRGVTGIVTGTKVNAVWRKKNIVILDTPTTAAGASVSVTFKSQSFSGRTVDCDGDGAGICLALDAAARIDAGASAGGTAAGGTGKATGYLIGGPNGSDKVAGFTSSMSASYGHSIDYHIQNSHETRMYSPAGDANGNYDDPNTVFLLVDGDANQASFIGGKAAKAGTSIIVDAGADQCVNYVAANASTTTNSSTQFEVDGGCFIAQGMRPGSGYAYVANAASNVSLGGSYLDGTSIVYEGDTARGVTSTLGAFVSSGQTNLVDGQLVSSGMAPTASGNGVGTGPTVSGNQTAGRVRVGTSPTGSTVKLTFASPWLVAPVCFGQDESTAGGNAMLVTSSTKTDVTFKVASPPAASDNLSYSCIGYK
ncbi:MAG TPA: hypothetical protein VG889_00385 [Rhizomicrobium sp.]|nr:hypothetical protein [Rhizomicrobium sp.]